MTDNELREFCLNPPAGTISVSMSKHGFFLKTENISHEITGNQAAILFEVMPLMMRRRATHSSGERTK
jgi:hypothetical protein